MAGIGGKSGVGGGREGDAKAAKEEYDFFEKLYELTVAQQFAAALSGSDRFDVKHEQEKIAEAAFDLAEAFTAEAKKRNKLVSLKTLSGEVQRSIRLAMFEAEAEPPKGGRTC